MNFFQCLNFKCQLKIAFKSPLLWKSSFSWFHFVSSFKQFLLFTQLHLKILQCSDLPILVNKLVHFSLYFYFSVLHKNTQFITNMQNGKKITNWDISFWFYNALLSQDTFQPYPIPLFIWFRKSALLSVSLI